MPDWIPLIWASADISTSLENKVGYDPTSGILFVKPGSVPRRNNCMPPGVGGHERYGAFAREWLLDGGIVPQ